MSTDVDKVPNFTSEAPEHVQVRETVNRLSTIFSFSQMLDINMMRTLSSGYCSLKAKLINKSDKEVYNKEKVEDNHADKIKQESN